MKITPLVIHAAARLPQISDMFADTVNADITATSGGEITIDCAEPHGFTIGSKVAVCIKNARIELPIIGAVDNADGTATLEFSAIHGLSNNATNPRVNSWNPTIELTGFDDEALNGEQEFLSVVSPTECLITLPDDTDPTQYLTPTMFEPNNTSLNGWRPVTVIDETTLEAPAGPLISRDCMAQNVTVATNIRIWGVIDFEAIQNLYSQEDSQVSDLRMFVSPLPMVAMSKDRAAKSSGVADLGPNVHFRQTLMDGFHIVVVVPIHEDKGAIRASDLIHGPVLGSIFRTFQGLRIFNPDLPGAEPLAAILKHHSGRILNTAYYVHDFEFEASLILSNRETIKAHEVTVGGMTETVDNPADIDNIPPAEPTGTTPFGEISFEGLYNGDLSQPLTASILYEDQAS